MAAKKKIPNLKGKSSGKKVQNRTKKRSSRKKGVQEPERIIGKDTKAEDRYYPELDIDQERAVLYFSARYSIEQVSEILGYSKNTIYKWRAEKPFKDALEREGSLVIQLQRDRFHRSIDEAFNTLHKGISGKNGSPSLAFQVLKETGHLPTTKEKSAQKKQVEQLLAQFLAEMKEAVDGGLGESEN
ncbi:DNA-binding protein [Leptospira langatensis]|uniref:DNA-binding protein n=1 Tax=Leptospira langatensis TaxID=2484983 RepID=A0A5R2ATK9_9LEPT|nr:helix-turn-helix domain-containing protein [Leptospira langatensis]TGJ99900.1 DNA-binding protein [Leptospira langatensis]